MNVFKRQQTELAYAGELAPTHKTTIASYAVYVVNEVEDFRNP